MHTGPVLLQQQASLVTGSVNMPHTARSQTVPIWAGREFVLLALSSGSKTCPTMHAEHSGPVVGCRQIRTDNLGHAVLGLLTDMRCQKFNLPSTLSYEVQDLITRLLNPEPSQRITVKQVMNHPWFMEGLPDNATNMNGSYLRLQRSCPQSEEEIRYIVERAAVAEHNCGWGGTGPTRLSIERAVGMA